MIQFTLTALLLQMMTVTFPHTTLAIPSISQVSSSLEDDVVPPRIVPQSPANHDDDVVPPR